MKTQALSEIARLTPATWFPGTNMSEDVISRTEELLSRRNVKAAAKYCLRMIRSNPGDRDLLLYAPSVAALAGRSYARRMLRILLSAHREGDHDLSPYIAALTHACGKTDEALKLFARIPKRTLPPNMIWVWLNCLREKRRYATIRAWIETSCPFLRRRLQREDTLYYGKLCWLIGDEAIRTRNWICADKYFRVLLKTDPNWIEHYYNYALVQFSCGRKSTARKTLLKGLKISNQQVNSCNLLCEPGKISARELNQTRRQMRQLLVKLKA